MYKPRTEKDINEFIADMKKRRNVELINRSTTIEIPCEPADQPVSTYDYVTRTWSIAVTPNQAEAIFQTLDADVPVEPELTIDFLDASDVSLDGTSLIIRGATLNSLEQHFKAAYGQNG